MKEVLQFALLGLGAGSIYALLATGLVLIYRGSGVLNFSQGALAMVAAFVFNTLHVNHAWSVAPAMLVSVALVAVFGLMIDQVLMRRMRHASPLARAIVTLGVLLLAESIGLRLWGSTPTFVQPFIGSGVVDVLGAQITWYELIVTAIAVVLTAALALFWHHSRAGWVMEAVSENQRSAAALGWSPELVSAATWVSGSALAGISGVLIAPLTPLGVDNLTFVVVFALAASLMGGFVSFTITLVGGLLLGIAQAEVGNYVHVTGASDALPLLVIVGLLVLRGSPLPIRGHVADRLPSVGSGRIDARFVTIATVVVGVAISLVTAGDWVSALTATFATAVVLLSLVVVIGYAGQLSLAQYALAGIGALIAARLVANEQWPIEFAFVAGVLGAMAVGILFALPALRTRGVNLAIVTLGLGFAVQSAVFDSPTFSNPAGLNVSNQTLLGWSIDPLRHAGRYLVVVFVIFVFCAVAVARIRRGASGRQLLAMRANERAAAACGVNVFGAKLQAFAVSGAIAGIGGCLLGFSQPTATFSTYSPIDSLSAVAASVIGGVGYLLGAVVGAITSPISIGSVLALHWQSFDTYLPIIAAVAVLVTLVASPDGVLAALTRALSRASSVFRARSVEAAEMLSEGKAHRVISRALSIDDITVRYGGVIATNRISLKVGPGEVHGLIGPNGAGKTSLMDAVSGFAGYEGQVRLGGLRVDGWSPHRRARAGLVRSFQSLELFDDMTVLENLQVAGEHGSAWSVVGDLLRPRTPRLSSAAASAIHEFQLVDCLDKLPGELSYGQRRLVGVARAVAMEPSVLLLDEPVAGLDDNEAREFARLVRRLADEWGMAVLVIEHHMDFVMSICDRITVIDFGSQVSAGTPAEVQHDTAARAAYLGA
jgi:ABC-type branched-subunit amino acid transport system ATPase component/branched-subunit amino acid ABC-type transport system permease component